MSDERQGDGGEQDRRELYRDVWGSAPAERSFAERKQPADMPPLVERGSIDHSRLEQLERSVRDVRSQVEELRGAVAEMQVTIERIARRLQLAGYTEAN